MSCVCILTPVVIAAWPAFSAAVVAAANSLGYVLAEQNKLPEAIEQYSEALRLNQDNPEAQFNLGMALARQGKREDACAHYHEALRLKPDYLAAQQQLSALMTQTNR